MTTTIADLKVDLSGGCELLFGNQKTLVLDGRVPTGTSLRQLVLFLRDNCVTERPDQWVNGTGDGLRPGILALVNDCDAEVMGGFDYCVQEKDTVAFISTLHGG